MWDGWETRFGCRQKIGARLYGYTRSFTKASVRNWGTQNLPGPTLNLSESSGHHCDGIAFEFSDLRSDEVFSYLREREGKNFAQMSRDVVGSRGETIPATVFSYGGKNVIVGKSIDDIAGE
jgi:cation transport protein ChaC